ncbi:MAG: Gfo/Idh/MocA family oxidoreductase [Proteobacteria bacterium]|nr:Gfo/Idh/MocA family oxidoreductase [Pseudomonadota bacterium]
MGAVKVGVVGIGYLGKFHAEKYAHLPEAELVGVVDSNLDRAREAAARFQVPAYDDYRMLLGTAQAVSIVVPTPLHYEIAREFLQRGVDVLLEKPMTTTLAQADDLIAIARAQGLILQVGHLERFNAALLAIKDIVKKPLFIESHRIAPFKERGIEVDVILDLMIHDIDIILTLVNAPVTAIHAVGVPVLTSTTDIANVRLQFATGCIANVTASRISAKVMRKIRIFQNDAYLSMDFAAQEVDVFRKISNPDAEGIPNITYENIDIEQGDSLAQEIKAFLQAVRDRQQPEVPGEAGRNALKVALEIVEQIKANQAVFS